MVLVVAQNTKKNTKKEIKPEWDQAARQTTEQLTQKYSLNADQAKQVYTIQVRKQRNLSEIAALKTENQAQYQQKLQAVQHGTLASMRKTLKTKEQVTLFEQTKRDIRNKRAIKRKEMMSAKADKNLIEVATLDIFEE